jgi:hypothetical protein
LSEDEKSSSPSRKLSIVVGSVESSRSIERCLDALSVSCKDIDAEMIVVNAGVDPVVGHCTAKAANAQLITMPHDSLTPRLWSEGIATSSGEIVAILTGHCIVTVPWARALLSSVERGAAAAGGPLRLAADASHVDAAIFFLRYSAFLEGRSNAFVSDIAGDNAAYVRARIPAGSWSRESGFWELDVNRAILQSGDVIVWSEEAAVEFTHSFSFASICRHRFAHGRLFGASRVAGGESRMKIVLASPLVPFMLAVRIGRRVMRIARYRVRFLLVLPLILVLAACWAFGEAVGAMDKSVAHRS